MYRILNHTEIDTQYWDACVSNSVNASLYGMSWYLNILAGNWKGIVKGNYEAVFPVISKKKFGLSYIYQPMGIPSVSWYSATKPNPLDYVLLFNYISSHYDLAEFNFMCQANPERLQPQMLTGANFRVKQCLDFQKRDFDDVRKQFSRGHKHAIRRATRHSTTISKETQAVNFWKVAQTSLVFKSFPGYNQNRKRMEALITTTLSNNTGQIWTSFDGEKPLSSAFLIEANDILYFIFLFTLEEGRTNRVNHLLIQEIIKYNCNRILTLDFGGSNIEKIALFNRGFGTRDHYYMAIRSGRMCQLITKVKSLNWRKPRTRRLSKLPLPPTPSSPELQSGATG